MDERPKPIALAVVFIFVPVPVLVLASYVAGYFALPIRHPNHRQFDESWQAEFYKPAATIEGFLTGKQIDTCSG